MGIRHVAGSKYNPRLYRHFSRIAPDFVCLYLGKYTVGYHGHAVVKGIIISTLLCCYIHQKATNTCSLPDLLVCFHADGFIPLALTTRWLLHLYFMALLPKSFPGTICELLIKRSGGAIASSNQIIRSVSGYFISVLSLPHCSTAVGSFLICTQKWTLRT